jgi:hypothetical protein
MKNDEAKSISDKELYPALNSVQKRSSAKTD